MSLNQPRLPVEIPSSGQQRGLGIAAVALIALTCVVSVLEAVTTWNGYGLAEDYLAGGTGVTGTDLVDADDLTLTIGRVLLFVGLLTPVVFLAWLWRARQNAELINRQAQDLARGWTIGGWFVPVINLWYPYRIVYDIWRVSHPGGVLVSNHLVRWWWTSWILTWLGSVWLRAASRQEGDLDALWNVTLANTATTVFHCLAGGFVIVLIRQITAWQAAPRPA
ncbi:DUF4328 domain-containing protein [Actinophytocola sediminis]